jgi:DNA invertase Pin-like site-specific DNA recombinase
VSVNAVAYLRVSTEEQAKANNNGTGFGLAVQRDQVVAWAEAEGRTIVGWHVDAGKSGGAGLEVRMALGDALTALAEKRATELVVPELSRLSRDLALQELLLGEIRAAGARLRSCDSEEDRVCEEGGEDDDPTRTLIRQIMGSIKQYERAMIRLRLMRGAQRKRRAGGYTGGTTGYGIEVVDGVLVAVPSPVRDLILELRAEGMGYEAISEELNRQAIPGPEGNLWHRRSVMRAWKRWQAIPARQ